MDSPEEELRPPAVRRLADWLGREWHAVGTLGRIAVVLGGLAATSLVLLAVWTDWIKDVKEPPLLVAPSAPAGTNGVAATAWLDPTSEGSRVRLWIVFRNDSKGKVSNLRYLKLDTPGFRSLSCMKFDGPDCRPQGRGQPSIEGPLPDLASDQSVAVFGIVAPTDRASHRGVSGVFGWRQAEADHVGSIIVAEVPAESELRRALAYAGHLVLFVRDLVKDLAWPVVLALLAWYLKRRDDRREREEKDAERKREIKEKGEKEQQEAREHRQERFQQTWNLMLPKSHSNAEKHYMPVLNRVDELCRSATLKDATRLLWALLTLFRAMRELSLSIGGFYFRDLEAESLAGRCWLLFFLRAEDGLERRNLEFAIDLLASSETLDTFSRRLEPVQGAAAEGSPEAEPTHVKDAAEVLKTLKGKDWMSKDGLRLALPLVKVMSCILSYEMNRTY